MAAAHNAPQKAKNPYHVCAIVWCNKKQTVSNPFKRLPEITSSASSSKVRLFLLSFFTINIRIILFFPTKILNKTILSMLHPHTLLSLACACPRRCGGLLCWCGGYAVRGVLYIAVGYHRHPRPCAVRVGILIFPQNEHAQENQRSRSCWQTKSRTVNIFFDPSIRKIVGISRCTY